MEKYRYTKENEDKCRQKIGWKENCYKCLYQALCEYEKNQERIKDTPNHRKDFNS